jgi:hypothetical protein
MIIKHLVIMSEYEKTDNEIAAIMTTHPNVATMYRCLLPECGHRPKAAVDGWWMADGWAVWRGLENERPVYEAFIVPLPPDFHVRSVYCGEIEMEFDGDAEWREAILFDAEWREAIRDYFRNDPDVMAIGAYVTIEIAKRRDQGAEGER